MKINGLIYLVLGAFVTAASYYVTDVTETTNMKLFFYAGIIIGVYGIGKFAIFDMKEKRQNRPKGLSQQRWRKNPHQPQPMQQQQGMGTYCYGCGAPILHYYTYCPRCGMRIK